MRKILIVMILLALLPMQVSALEITAPQVTGEAAERMPRDPETFWEGLMVILSDALGALHPDLKEAGGLGMAVTAAVLLVSLTGNLNGNTGKTADLVGALCIFAILMSGTRSLIHLGSETVTQLSEYGKLLLPVMTAALAAQGGVTASSALYTGTAALNAFLTSLISGLMVPLLYIYLALGLANSALGEELLKKLKDLIKWCITRSLRTVLYVFTGFMGITGVVSGTADAAALKATRLTISGVVPVVGGILSDASEAVLVSAGLVKNAAGIYGILAILALCLLPFLRIGVHYLLLKAVSAVCALFGRKPTIGMIQDFSDAMGLLLAMTGSECLLFLISTVCFLRGVN